MLGVFASISRHLFGESKYGFLREGGDVNGMKRGQCRLVDPQLETSKRHASEGFGCDVETMFPHIILPHHTFHSALVLLSDFRFLDGTASAGCGERCLPFVLH